MLTVLSKVIKPGRLILVLYEGTNITGTWLVKGGSFTVNLAIKGNVTFFKSTFFAISCYVLEKVIELSIIFGLHAAIETR